MDINNYFLVFPVLLPIFAGVLLMFLKFGKREHMQLYILTILIVDSQYRLDRTSAGRYADTESVLYCRGTSCVLSCGYTFKDFLGADGFCMADGWYCIL